MSGRKCWFVKFESANTVCGLEFCNFFVLNVEQLCHLDFLFEEQELKHVLESWMLQLSKAGGYIFAAVAWAFLELCAFKVHYKVQGAFGTSD